MACVMLSYVSSQEMLLLELLFYLLYYLWKRLFKENAFFLRKKHWKCFPYSFLLIKMFYLFQKLRSKFTTFINSSQINPFPIRIFPYFVYIIPYTTLSSFA